MAAPDGLYRLVERFEGNRDAYRSGRYNETQARVEFINPLFELLGWDIDNRSGALEAYKDVVHEDAIKVGGAHKAPDYGFRVGGTRKFFVEAKKPSVNLRDDVDPSFQLRRYAWSAKLPVSILTDFEEFAVYDCRITPDKDDSPATARLQFHSFDQYPDKWDEIAGVFSKEAVLGGSLDIYAEKAKSRRGTETVDAVFLKEIESWRETLARDLAMRNPALTIRELNYAVQVTIDRIIFLRMTEDRGIEDYGRLQALLNGEHVYERLRNLYRQADERYNSGLFHFQPEKGRGETQDTLTPKLEFGDTALRSIIKGLYYPDSPYEFSVLPIEVLGQVYEQFLGKVIDLSPNRAVKIEEKPEVRKAGGVYYTPKYIVDYIVEQTVGKLVEGKKPGARGGVSKLRIVDPACGSGSFLIGAYEYLLDWHRDQYIEDGVEKHTKEIYQGRGGEWHLTTSEKKRILLNNIYGVDIDPQAVEVTKLSLLLKVLEGESSESLVTQLSLFRERALPDLSNNVKCGNSLIGPDFYDSQQLSLMDDEYHYRLNVFDWRHGFPEAFERRIGGFDAVIGNPPYIRMEAFKDLKAYLSANYGSHSERADLYAYFLERGLSLLQEGGLLGLIISNKFIKAKYGRALRRVLSEDATIKTLADFAGADVFEGATVRTIVLIARKSAMGQTSDAEYVPVPSSNELTSLVSGGLTVREYASQKRFELHETALTPDEWQLIPREHSEILSKIRHQSEPLATWAGSTALFGLKTGLNEAFIIDETTRRELISMDGASSKVIVPILFGRDVRRYSIRDADRYVIYLHPTRNVNDYPAIEAHLARYKNRLLERAANQRWYELQQPATGLIQVNTGPKIVYPIIANECRFTIDDSGYFINDKLFVLPTNDEGLLGLLNSKLSNYYFMNVCAALEGAKNRYLEFRAQYVDPFPISQRFAKSAVRDNITELSARMLELHRQAGANKLPDSQRILQHQIDATDRQIDQLVYELYGLTDEEIAVVEEATT